MAVAQQYQDQLKRIKKNIEKSYIYFKPNFERFHEFQRFTYKTNLTDGEVSTLQALGKPVVESNICNSFVSRLCGEFSKQEPSIEVRADSGTQVDPQVIEVVEGHIRHIIFDAHKKNTQYNIYKDQLTGGFSCYKLWTEYANEMSFDQVIKIGRVYEPTLTGFDPMARETTKSDADYWFEVYPMTEKDFKVKYPKVDITKLTFTREEEGFNWSYNTDREGNVLMLIDYFEKKKVKKKIVTIALNGQLPQYFKMPEGIYLSDNNVMTMDDYNIFVNSWNEQQITEQPPAIINQRNSTFESVCRYRLTGSDVIGYKETDFKIPNFVFVDGDSVIIKEGGNSSYQQFTKPYLYHVKGIQRVKNLALQCLANELEDMPMHKIMAGKSSIPQEEGYLEAWKNPQKSAVFVYNDVDELMPDRPIAPPITIPRMDPPSIIANAFGIADQTMQAILGSYDASLGINDNQLSGVAIVEGATQSNAAAMPFIVSYMAALNQLAQGIIDLIPKYFKTPRTIPIVGRDGKRSYQKINQEGGVSFDYDSNCLSVQVEAGVSYNIAKNKALQQIIALMQASPLFAQFINEEGLDVLLDNMEFRGVDIIKSKVEGWVQKMQQMKQQAAQQPNPDQIKAQIAQGNLQLKMNEMQSKQQMHQSDTQIDMAKLQGDIQVNMAKVQADMAKVQADLQVSQDQNKRENERLNMDHLTKVHEHALKHTDQQHRHAKETIETIHNINQSEKQNESQE